MNCDAPLPALRPSRVAFATLPVGRGGVGVALPVLVADGRSGRPGRRIPEDSVISAPRTPPVPCPAGCLCDVCGDALVRAWADDRTAVHEVPDAWRADDMQPRTGRRDHVLNRAPRAIDLDAFDRHFAALHERIGRPS